MEWIPEFEGQEFPGLLDQVFQTGEPYVGTEKRVLLAGDDPAAAPVAHYVDFLYEPVREADGTVTGVFVHGVDVTAQVETRKSVRALVDAAEADRQRLQAVLDVLPVAVFMADADGQLLEANPVASVLWNGEVPLVGTDRYGLYGGWWPGTGERIAAEDWPLARALRGGEAVVDEEVDIECFDGARKAALISALPIHDRAGQLVGGVVAMVDVTPLKRTQRELRRLNESLEARVTERTQQVNALATELTLAEQRERQRISYLLHEDLQQQLYGTQLQVSLLESSALREDEAAVQAHTERLKTLLDGAIRTTRTLAVDLSPPVLHDEGLEGVLGWLVGHVRERHGLHAELVVNGPCVLPVVEHRVLLFHLVRELLFNVVKHAGTDRARIEVEDEGDRLRIEVSDEGEGFAGDVSHESGSGFGLYSVRERLRLFGGSLDMVSQPGRGTRATITILTTSS